jgi:hypothetical protein
MALKVNFQPHTKIKSAEMNVNMIYFRDRDVIGENLTSQVTGSATVFTLAYPYIAGSVIVFVDGIRQLKTSDYTESGTLTITFLGGRQPASGQDLVVDYHRSDL